MTNYLSQRTKLEQAQNKCQEIVDKAVKYGWTPQLENALYIAQKFEVMLHDKLFGTTTILKKVHAEHFS